MLVTVGDERPPAPPCVVVCLDDGPVFRMLCGVYHFPASGDMDPVSWDALRRGDNLASVRALAADPASVWNTRFRVRPDPFTGGGLRTILMTDCVMFLPDVPKVFITAPSSTPA